MDAVSSSFGLANASSRGDDDDAASIEVGVARRRERRAIYLDALRALAPELDVSRRAVIASVDEDPWLAPAGVPLEQELALLVQERPRHLHREHRWPDHRQLRELLIVEECPLEVELPAFLEL